MRPTVPTMTPIVDGQGVTCTAPVINTALDGAVPCATWGMAYNDLGAGISSGPNGLVIVPQNQVNSVAGCYSLNSQPFGVAGVTMRVTDVLRGTTVYTTLQLAVPTRSRQTVPASSRSRPPWTSRSGRV